MERVRVGECEGIRFVNRIILAITLFFLFLNTIEAQEDIPTGHYIYLQHDNDYFNLAGKGTDRYYTGGHYIKYAFTSKSRYNFLG